ncbi:CUE domain-containing protein [Phthorimaea operculella]|nr:CUE domain-containing protein [Phthorimaea operculella]
MYGITTIIRCGRMVVGTVGSSWQPTVYGAVLVLLALAAACVMLASLTVTDHPAPRLCRGSRYVSWLPSFSVEVTRVRAPPTPPHQLQHMARQVQQLFPQYGLNVLLADLAVTRSADLTVNNILEGRLPAPIIPETPPPPPPQPAPATRTDNSSGISATEVVHLPRAAEPSPARDAATNTADTSATPATPIPASNTQYVYHTDVGHSSTIFSKDASEREVQLQRRKEQLIAAARQKYLEKMQTQQTQTNSQDKFGIQGRVRYCGNLTLSYQSKRYV